MPTRKRKKLHPTGQLSIFAILIFQALFILFAMSLNIALVVHDKINLQNSVDIATYYGAMKQAEMMNIIGHVNYQIRQSWKLLVWRYRVLGSVGITDNPGWRPARQRDIEHPLPAYRAKNIPGPYFFCVGHRHWGYFTDGQISTRDDNTCTDMNQSISALTIPKVSGTVGSFAGMLHGVANMAKQVNIDLKNKCDLYGFNSWLLGMMSFFHFRRDQSARKYMIYELARVMSGAKYNHPHGTDINGQSIADGVTKTFQKNLSFINKSSFAKSTSKLKQFNSLTGASPEQWLADQAFYDLGFYAKLEGKGGCQRSIAFLNNPPASAAGQPQTTALLNEIGIHDPWPACANTKQCQASAGLKKDPEFHIFYSVKAELDYGNQIFLPFSQNIKLKAKAFAKPFGGRIGPDASADPRLPPADSLPATVSAMEFDKRYAPNYSRYPGDPWGLRSAIVHYHWARHIKQDKRQNNIKHYVKENYPTDHDPLAKGQLPPGLNLPARKWELAAVAPDLFDITYFTILPYYAHTYFPKIQNLVDPNYLRGDLGMHKEGGVFIMDKTVLEQVGYNSDLRTNIWSELQSFHPSFSKPFYKIPSLDFLLTGWNPPKKKYTPGDDDYIAEIDATNFGECSHWVHNVIALYPGTAGKIANGCIYGGRTGYSIKLVSKAFLEGFSSVKNTFPDGDAEWY